MSRADRTDRRRSAPAGALSVYIGERDVTWTVTTDAKTARSQPAALARVPMGTSFPQPVADRLRALAAVLDGIDAGPARRLRFIVADSWLATASVAWRAADTGVAQQQAHARQCLAALGHVLADDDQLRLDTAAYGCCRLCIAYPAPLLALLRDCARRLRLPLVSVQPLSRVARRLAGTDAPGRALMVVDDGMVLVCAASGGAGPHIDDLLACTRASEDALDCQAWMACWRRACLRHPTLPPQPGPVVLDVRGCAT